MITTRKKGWKRKIWGNDLNDEGFVTMYRRTTESRVRQEASTATIAILSREYESTVVRNEMG